MGQQHSDRKGGNRALRLAGGLPPPPGPASAPREGTTGPMGPCLFIPRISFPDEVFHFLVVEIDHSRLVVGLHDRGQSRVHTQGVDIHRAEVLGISQNRVSVQLPA